jgi:hypothetical protein
MPEVEISPSFFAKGQAKVSPSARLCGGETELCSVCSG